MLHVDKVDSFLTETVKIGASNLKEFTNYKFELRLHADVGTLRSYCVLQSDGFGEIDLTTGKPLRGTYTDSDPMGLFMTVERTNDILYGSLPRYTDGTPLFYTLRLLSESEELLDQVNLKKRFINPNVEVMEVKQHGIWGVIYKPPGSGPFPCIIDTPLLNGKHYKNHGYLFAAEGFLSFSFSMFDEPGLPATMQEVEIEYLSKHIKFVQSLPYCSDKIGLYGNSIAGTISLHLSTKHPEFSAVCLTNPPEAFYREGGYLRENGKPIACETINNSLNEAKNGVVQQRAAFSDAFSRLRPETSIQWDCISKRIAFRLFIAIDDWILDGVSNASRIRDHLQSTAHYVETEFANAGHVTLVPYMPHSAFVYNKFIKVILGLGGETWCHSKALEAGWANHIKFFKKHLGTPRKVLDYERDTKVVIPKKDEKSKL